MYQFCMAFDCLNMEYCKISFSFLDMQFSHPEPHKLDPMIGIGQSVISFLKKMKKKYDNYYGIVILQ